MALCIVHIIMIYIDIISITIVITSLYFIGLGVYSHIDVMMP